MTKIVSIGGAPISSEAAGEFSRVLCGMTQDFSERFGQEPEALVFVLSDSAGNILPGWLMRGACEGRSEDKIALASIVLSWTLRNTADD